MAARAGGANRATALNRLPVPGVEAALPARGSCSRRSRSTWPEQRSTCAHSGALPAASYIRLCVGDGDGLVVIPAYLADDIAAEATEMTTFEDFVQQKVLEGRSILGLYPPTEERSRTDFAAWREANGR